MGELTSKPGDVEEVQRILAGIRVAMKMAHACHPDERHVFVGDRRLPAAAAIEKNYDVWFPAIAPKVFSHPFEWFHRLFLDWYWPLLKLRASGATVPADIPLAALLCLGRGLGKSAILEGVSLAEGAHFGEAFGLYISSTKDKCGEHLQNVRALIESSEIARYYPGLSSPRIGKFGNQRGWKADAIYTQGGFTLIAASLEQGVRGLRDLERRPSFILLDDIDERDDSLQVKQEKFETLSKDIVPMLAPYGLVLYAQNLIYSGSVMDDTINRKIDWFHLRHQVGPINTFQDDLEIEKIDGRPVITEGTPNWSRIDRPVAQDMLNKSGEESFWVECQNRTQPSPEKRVWKNFSESVHVITWAQFSSVFRSNRIPAHWYLYAGYDAGTTGPERHPAAFSVAAVAAENSPMPSDVFVFYEYVAEAVEVEDDMAKALIEDLAKLCDNPAIRQAAELVARAQQEKMTEADAWKFRRQAGRMIPFKIFNGSHEAASERRTFQKWGLSIQPGLAGKTEGLPQLRFYLNPERKPHPFKANVTGRPNIYLVVANDQVEAARDRFGLQRHRWEAANLKNDPNITSRDVPVKFGDDITDCVKHYLQTFALVARPKTLEERIEDEMPERFKQVNLQQTEYNSGQELGYWIQRAAAKRAAQAKSRVKRFDDRLKPIK
jgi:hypothetical protein